MSTPNEGVPLGSARGVADGETHDFVLWSRARTGDAEAFGLLFRQYANAIYNYCFRRVGDWAAAEDLTSIVFLEAWRRRDKELEPGFVRAWLFGIATNVVRNRQRAERRYKAALARIPRDSRIPGFADETEARLDDERKMRVILADVRRLSGPQKEVLALCVWSNFSYEEAALALDVPIGTIRSRLWQARRRLRQLDGGSGHVPRQKTGRSSQT